MLALPLRRKPRAAAAAAPSAASGRRAANAASLLSFLLPLLLLLASGLVTLASGGCGRQGPPENLILVSLDTLRADHLSCYGYGRETSPRLDALATESVLFENVVSQSNETVRSHVSLFTSAYPFAALVDPRRRMLAEILAERGLATAAFTDGGPMARGFGPGFERGFETYTDTGKGLAVKGRQALAWLDQLPEGRPFFLFVHCFDIHLPYDPPAPWNTFFGKDNPSRIKPRETATIARKVRRILDYADFQGEVELSPADRQKMVDLYDCGIRYADEMLGLFLDGLRERGLLERSVLVVFSDHGEEFWDHGSLLHDHTLYQELTRVPLIVRLPGLAPRRVARQVALLDLAPTVLQALGMEGVPGMEGQSLLPLLRGEEAPASSRPLFSEGMGGLYAVHAEGYKLIRRPDLRRWELYRLSEDPREQRSLAAAERERVARLDRLIQGHHQELVRVRQQAGAAGRPADRPLDPATRRRLEELGYLAPSPGAKGEGGED